MKKNIHIKPTGRKKIIQEYKGCTVDFKEPLKKDNPYSMGRQLIGEIIDSYTHGLVIKTLNWKRKRVPFTHITGIWPKHYIKKPSNRIPFTMIHDAANNGGNFPTIKDIREKKGGKQKENQ